MNKLDISQINYADTKTWELIKSGATKNIFQCESRLLSHWLKKIQPNNLWELSIILALVRPGALNSGTADDYVAYKNKVKEFQPIHPIVDRILETTNHCLVFQESLMQIGANLAWPHLPDKEKSLKVDELRKAVGKKNQEKILKIGKEFVEGCLTNKVEAAVAARLFEIIKNCGRYLFNLSHSFAYGVKAYESAYLKANYPLQSLAVYLSYAQFKQAHKKEGKTFGGKWNEIEEIVNEGRKYLGVELLAPNINSKNENFAIENGAIRYGLGHIKYFGNSIDKVKKLPRIDKWQQVLLLLCTDRFGFKLKATTGEALIKTGCFADTKVSRSDLLTVYTLCTSLTEREMEKLADLLENNSDQPITSLKDLLTDVVSIATKRRKETLEDEIKLLKLNQFDNPQWVEQVEKHYMGLPINTTALDNISEQAGYGCQDLHDSLPLYTTRQIHLIIDDVKTTVTKTGKNPGQEMCFVTGHDATGKVDRLPIFPELYATLKDDLFPPQMFCLTVHKGKGGWFVKEGYKLDTTRDSGKMQLSD